MNQASTRVLCGAALLGAIALFIPASQGQTPAIKAPPSVSVPNTADIPICRSNTSDNGNQVSETGTLYTVPAGKRLVIETISARVATASGQSVIGNIGTRIGGQNASTNLLFVFQGNDGTQAKYAATHSVRLYAEAGSSVTFTTVRTDKNAVGNKNVSFTGYLEPAG